MAKLVSTMSTIKAATYSHAFSCPYLTTVRATKVYRNQTVFEPESAVVDLPGDPCFNLFSFDGGFSNIYPQPSYQKEAADNFFAKHNPPYPYYEGSSSFGKNGGIFHQLGRRVRNVASCIVLLE